MYVIGVSSEFSSFRLTPRWAFHNMRQFAWPAVGLAVGGFYLWALLKPPLPTAFDISVFLVLHTPLFLGMLYCAHRIARVIFSKLALAWAIRRPEMRLFYACILAKIHESPLNEALGDRDFYDMARATSALARADAHSAVAIQIHYPHNLSELQVQLAFWTIENNICSGAETTIAYDFPASWIHTLSPLTRALFWLAIEETNPHSLYVVFPTAGLPDGSAHERLQFAADMEAHQESLLSPAASQQK